MAGDTGVALWVILVLVMGVRLGGIRVRTKSCTKVCTRGGTSSGTWVILRIVLVVAQGWYW